MESNICIAEQQAARSGDSAGGTDPRADTALVKPQDGRVEAKEPDEPQAKTSGAVCAHIGAGADNEQVKVARARLTKVLDRYRRLFAEQL